VGILRIRVPARGFVNSRHRRFGITGERNGEFGEDTWFEKQL
jgi:hypothetical protein